MNHNKFMAMLVEIYGKYSSEALQKLTYVYIKNRWKETELEGVFFKITAKINPKYKTPPNPADFEEVFSTKGDAEAEALEWYNKLDATGNSLDNIIVSNVRAQKALNSMGGWVEFCRRNPDYESLNRKRFIEAYVSATQEGVPYLMFGDSESRQDKIPLMFGDKEVCKTALEYKPEKTLNEATKFIESRRI